jgi:ABC-type Fe3+/spermidine/putrescine transport system ATPase subunit
MTASGSVERYVVAKGLTLRYPGATSLALDGVDFGAERGEVVTLLGPSGCGKTTALRLLAGLETPDAGSVTVAGRDVTLDPPERRRMGVVFQNYALFPHLTVFENVAFGLRVRRTGAGDTADAVREALALVGLEGFESRGVDQLSGGQQQRVAIARAIAIRPDVLLMDEPLSNLDASLREQTREALRELLERLDVTTFFVTHDQSEAFAFSDRIVLMRAGRVVESGVPARLYREPETTFGARFLGNANVLPTTVVEPSRTVAVSGRTLEAASWSDNARSIEVGGRATLVARPEALRLATADAANALPGRVVDRVFLGGTYRVAVELDGSRERVAVLTQRDPSDGPAWVVCPVDTLRVIAGELEPSGSTSVV